jgi:hypothetical protein
MGVEAPKVFSYSLGFNKITVMGNLKNTLIILIKKAAKLKKLK